MEKTKVSMERSNINKKPLTKIEKRIASAWKPGGFLPSPFNVNDPKCWPELRNNIKIVAYHEAGHFAARWFTQLEFSHIVRISIIPEETHLGVVVSERSFTRTLLKQVPPSIQRCQGRMLLLYHMAGRGAEIIIHESGGCEGILEYWEYDGEDEKDSDYSKAHEIAESMAKPYVSAFQILSLADKWTMEMLRMPTVWDVVETVADKLIECGEIADKRLQTLFDKTGYHETAIDIPKWRRRLLTEAGRTRPICR